jgi:hypothetical protein
MPKKQIDESDLIERLREIFVTQDIFELRLSPLEKIVYGLVGLTLFTVMGALLYFVIQKQ